MKIEGVNPWDNFYLETMKLPIIDGKQDRQNIGQKFFIIDEMFIPTKDLLFEYCSTLKFHKMFLESFFIKHGTIYTTLRKVVKYIKN